MTKFEFEKQLLKATQLAVDFSQNFITNNISKQITYDIEFNLSLDINYGSEFDVYPEDKNKLLLDVELSVVISSLYRKGKVPAWIDISVIKSSNSNTRLNLKCSGRFTNDLKNMYYVHQKTEPFGIKSPDNLPWIKNNEKYHLLYSRKGFESMRYLIRRRYESLKYKFRS